MVAAGFTVADPVVTFTLPTPLSIDTEVALATDQDNVAPCPEVIVEGEALKEFIVGLEAAVWTLIVIDTVAGWHVEQLNVMVPKVPKFDVVASTIGVNVFPEPETDNPAPDAVATIVVGAPP